MTDRDKQYRRHRRSDYPPRWVLFALAALTALGVFWNLYTEQQARSEAEVASQNAETLAEEVERACKAGDVKVQGHSICKQATEVREQAAAPSAPAPVGPAGPPGRDGVRGVPGPAGRPGPAGEDGRDSNVPGPAGQPGQSGERGAPGSDGVNGSDGAPGSAGADGKDGANGKDGAAGPPGPAGERGPAGADGKDGADGRGISSITCNADNNWVVTYTDNGTETVPGPCRVAEITP